MNREGREKTDQKKSSEISGALRNITHNVFSPADAPDKNEKFSVLEVYLAGSIQGTGKVLVCMGKAHHTGFKG